LSSLANIRIELAVAFEGGRKHLPIVTIFRVP